MSRTHPLFVQISAADPRPLSRQLLDGIRMQIASGELPVGSQLPSVRGLATQLTLNHNTVAKAYSDLAAEGWVDTRPGLGLFVATPRQTLSESERQRRLEQALRTFSAEVVGLGYSLDELMEQIEQTLAPCLPRKRA